MSLSEIRKKMALRKIDLMHYLFGELPDRKCKDCQHLVSYTANRKYYKCECYGNTHGPGTDWRLKWTACSLIDKSKADINPAITIWRMYNKPEEEQIEGQVSLFDNT